MRFNVRARSVAIVAGAVLVFGVALPMANTGFISGATGNRSAVGGKSPVKKPVTTTVPTSVTTTTKRSVTKRATKPVTKRVAKTLLVKVSFAAPSAVLSPRAKSQLAALAKELVSGASVTINGYSKSSAGLSKDRAVAVEAYLKSKTKVNFSVKLIPTIGTSVNGVTVKVTQP